MTTSSAESNPRTRAPTLPGNSRRRQKTKRASLIALLSRKYGADVGTISEKLGWQPHTTRAALARLRKGGYEICSEKSGNGTPTRYRITEGPSE